ncbi:MAG: hypothetical protein QNJ97_23645, partial [Myxococcota bacterium]|nr:hypothetical protein [Myxococcota bacterium]
LKTIAWTIENPPAPFFKGDSFLAILRYKNTQKSLTECHCPFSRGRALPAPASLETATCGGNHATGLPVVLTRYVDNTVHR